MHRINDTIYIVYIVYIVLYIYIYTYKYIYIILFTRLTMSEVCVTL